MKESEPSKATESWLQVVNDFRRVCFLKRYGKVDESQTILAVELPKSIALWSGEEARDGVAQRQALQEMFISEERRVEDAWQMKSLLQDQLRTELLEDVREEVRRELQRERSLTPQQAPPESRQTLSLSTSSRSAGVEPPSRPWKPPTLLRRTPTLPSSQADRPAVLDTSASLSATPLPLYENHEAPSLESTASLPAPARLHADIPENVTTTMTRLPEETDPGEERTTPSAATPRRGPSFDDLAAVLDFVIAGQSENDSAVRRQASVAS